MERFRATLRLPELHVLLFCFCCALFGWPLLLIAEQAYNEAIFVYLFTAWGIIIFLLFLIAGSLAEPDSDKAGHKQKEGLSDV